MARFSYDVTGVGSYVRKTDLDAFYLCRLVELYGSCVDTVLNKGCGIMSESVDWTNELYFYPYAEDKDVLCKMNRKEVRSRFREITEHEEKIINIQAYKCKLFDSQLTSLTMYHSFIVFETEGWWWSIENGGEGIVIQRSKSKAAVRDNCVRVKKSTNIFTNISFNERSKIRRNLRNYPVEGKRDTSTKTTWDLIDWLYRNDELEKAWHLVTSNCKAFAKRAFDFLGENENLYWFDGAFAEFLHSPLIRYLKTGLWLRMIDYLHEK